MYFSNPQELFLSIYLNNILFQPMNKLNNDKIMGAILAVNLNKVKLHYQLISSTLGSCDLRDLQVFVSNNEQFNISLKSSDEIYIT